MAPEAKHLRTFAFLDTEFIDLLQPQLLTPGAGVLDGKKFDAEKP
ncbi:hypothetical protein [Methylibium sp.]|nr:hypothetical protein [Methylibium sp.]